MLRLGKHPTRKATEPAKGPKRSANPPTMIESMERRVLLSADVAVLTLTPHSVMTSQTRQVSFVVEV